MKIQRFVSMAAMAAVMGALLLPSFLLAGPRSPIERRLRPGRGFWEDERPVRYRAVRPVEQRFSYAPRFDAGDKVMTTRRTDLRLGEKTLAKIKRGEKFEVLEVRGPWLKAELEREGKQVRGWVWDRHVNELSQAETK